MATTDNAGYVTLEMLHKMAKQPIFRRTTITRPLSEATEIHDTDFESDYDNSYDDDSSRRSVASLVADSVTTADTPRDVPTPDNGGALSSFHFHFDEKPIMGPNGPHLFRSSMSSDEMNNSYEVDFMLAKTPTVAFFDQSLTQQRKDTPLPGFEEVPESTSQVQQLKSINAAVSALDETEVRSWSPPDVVRWMQEVGFDDSVVEKFFINDISGAILLDLQVEDLKELDIQSFGKRRHLMNSIQHLRASIMLPNNESHTSFASRDQISSDCTSSSESASTPTKENKKKHRRRRHHRSHKKDSNAHKDLIPEDSASIVAIEQFLPKPHYCSKGEDCRKWQKQQRKIARLAKDLPIDIEAAQRLMSDDHEDQPLPTSKSLPNMEPLPTPSIVASSDVLGPEQTPIFQISEEKLNEICPRDPQENVRQYLNFQHLSRLQPVTQIESKSQLCSSPDVDSPDSTRTTTSLADNLRSLPKLTIPVNGQTLVPGAFSASLSAQRTVTPSILRRQPNFVTNSIDGTLHSAHQQAMAYGSSFSPADFASPSDFYRSHDVYQQASPLSEVDVPVTAIPAGPIERLASQSVPPNMRFGHHLRVVPDPYIRSSSTKPDNYRSGPSIQILGPVDEADLSNDSIDVPMTAIPGGPVERTDSQSVPPNMRFGREFYVPADPIYRPASTKASNYRYPSMVGSALDRVDEVGPIDTVEDFAKSSRTAPRSANDTTHSGWMRKRKTTKMLRHEWEDAHFTLKGTRLAMFEDERDSRRDSKALEYIDVDDYAVACSSLASSSKLTAAFKKTVLKRKPSAQDEAAFAFSLIPAANGRATAAERKNFFVSNGKSHHFAVKTRDERIDWMRELMLAKALKKGKDSGDSVHVNGYLF